MSIWAVLQSILVLSQWFVDQKLMKCRVEYDNWQLELNWRSYGCHQLGEGIADGVGHLETGIRFGGRQRIVSDDTVEYLRYLASIDVRPVVGFLRWFERESHSEMIRNTIMSWRCNNNSLLHGSLMANWWHV